MKSLRGEGAKAGSHILHGKPVERLRYEPGVKGANKKKDAH